MISTGIRANRLLMQIISMVEMWMRRPLITASEVDSNATAAAMQMTPSSAPVGAIQPAFRGDKAGDSRNGVRELV
jgi:hypothetical protein